jgi:hypothetical protein
VLTDALNSFKSGCLVMKRIVPPIELAPYNVPCGPRSTSIRSMSNNFGCTAPSYWELLTVTETSST